MDPCRTVTTGLIKAERTICILAFACCLHIDFKIKIFQAFQLTKQQEFIADSIYWAPQRKQQAKRDRRQQQAKRDKEEELERMYL